MKLSELSPKFLKYTTNKSFQTVTREEANGIVFLCPVCFAKNKGAKGTHSIICWDPTVPQSISPVPGRWKMDGTGFDNLTLSAKSSSVLIKGGCNAHFHITNGEIVL